MVLRLVAKADQCVKYQANGQPVEHLREASERLFAKLEKLNTKITALEIRNRSEQEAQAQLNQLFEECTTNPSKRMSVEEFCLFFVTQFFTHVDWIVSIEENRLGSEFER